tara:strand:+ start:3669 stop:4175 length:507 start_codon:yes stop_codon:yes gene_type:complete
MKIDFIIVSGILVILCFIPFILLPFLVSTKRKNLRRKFKEEALSLSINITFKLIWNSNIAGIDILKKRFLFVQEPDSDFLIHHVDLTKISQVKILSHYEEYSSHNKPVKNLTRVDLEFYENNTAVPLTVNLFNYALNYTQDYEIKNAEKLVMELQKYSNAITILKHTA